MKGWGERNFRLILKKLLPLFSLNNNSSTFLQTIGDFKLTLSLLFITYMVWLIFDVLKLMQTPLSCIYLSGVGLVTVNHLMPEFLTFVALSQRLAGFDRKTSGYFSMFSCIMIIVSVLFVTLVFDYPFYIGLSMIVLFLLAFSIGIVYHEVVRRVRLIK